MVDSTSNVTSVSDYKSRVNESSARHRFHQNVERGASRVFERYSDACASKCSFVLNIALHNLVRVMLRLHELFRSLKIAKLDESCGVAPSTATILVGVGDLNSSNNSASNHAAYESKAQKNAADNR